MSSYTLLDYTQTILSSLDGEEVNSISDTVESMQVASIVKTVYNDIQSRADLPEHYGLFELEASLTHTKPTIMYRPDDVSNILWIKYNCIEDGDTNSNWRTIKFLPINEFMDLTNNFNVDEDAVLEFGHTVGTSSLVFKYYNDRAPTYYSSFDDETLIFDSYDNEVDTTLQKTKTLCYGKKHQSFTMEDNFVPFIDRDFATLLMNEAKVLAFAELKQIGHDEARKWASRGWTKVQKSGRGVDTNRNELDRVPNYGR